MPALEQGNPLQSLLPQGGGVTCDGAFTETLDMRNAAIKCRNQFTQMTQRRRRVVFRYLLSHGIRRTHFILLRFQPQLARGDRVH
jgi:hypothetical protein